MRAFRAGTFLVLLAAACGAGTSCTTRPSLAREQFAFSLPDAPGPDLGAAKVLAVPTPEVAAAFDRAALVYRTGENAYSADPYAQFLAPPRELLGEAFRAQLRNSGLFREVRRSPEGADLVARLTVTGMYGDFRKPGAPVARLALQVTVTAGSAGAPAVLVKTYDRSVPIPQRKPDLLVAGLSQAVSDLASEIAADLKRAGVAP